MSTLYAVYNSDGCVSRCDAKCHNAQNSKCTCCCGGVFHGVGTKIPLANRNTLTDQDLIDNVRQTLGPGNYRIKRPQKQMELFP